jgi:hypothetical protein
VAQDGCKGNGRSNCSGRHDMIEFIIGLFCGAMLGILMAGLCVAASDADKEAEQMNATP